MATATTRTTGKKATTAAPDGPTGTPASPTMREQRDALAEKLARVAEAQASGNSEALAAVLAEGSGQDPAADGMSRRLRRQAVPHVALGVLTLAGCAARGAASLTGEDAAVAALVATISVIVAVVFAVVTRTRLDQPARFESSARRRALTIVAAAGSWLTAVAALTGEIGLVDMLGLLAGVGYLLALPYWREHRIPNRAPVITPAAPAAEPAEEWEPQPTAVSLWAENIGAKDGPLAGSYLTEPHVDARKEVYTAQLKPGKHSLASALAAIALIASGLLVGQEDVIIERHPTRDASKVSVTIVRESPIKETVFYPGPTYRWDPAKRTGLIALGPYADGEGDAVWQLFTPGSMWGGILIGGTGSGKSRLLEGMCCSALDSGHLNLWFGDPQRGISSVALSDHADWTARGPEECLTMLRALNAVAYWREIEASAHGWTGFTPGSTRTALLGVLDECHKVFDKKFFPEKLAAEAVALAENIARVGRKFGVALICASQEGDLSTFGGSQGLRNNLRAGNTVVLRTKNKQAKGILGLEFDPTTLPKLPGFGYTVEGEEIGGRTAPFRSYFLGELTDEEIDAVRNHGAPIPQGTAYWWLSQARNAELDEVASRGAGRAYRRRHEAAQEVAAELRHKLADLLSGVGPDLSQPNVAAAHAGGGSVGGGAHSMGAHSAGAQVIAFPRFAPPTAPDTADAAAAPGEGAAARPLTDSQRRMLRALAAGHDRPVALQQAVGLSERHVHNLLRELIDSGLAHQPRYGRYAPTDLGHRALAS